MSGRSLLIVCLVGLAAVAGIVIAVFVYWPQDSFDVGVQGLIQERETALQLGAGVKDTLPEYATFETKSQDLIIDIQVLKEAIAAKDAGRIGTPLGLVEEDIRLLESLPHSLENLDTSIFMVRAEGLVSLLLADIRQITGQIPESRQAMEQSQSEKVALVHSLEARNVELKTDVAKLESSLESLGGEKRGETDQAVSRFALVGGGALLAGFLLLIPWFKRFADEEEYWGFSVKGTGRVTPVRILIIASGVAVILLVAYVLVQGYIGAML